MAFELNQIVPWGRSYDEYVAMFSLSPQDLEKSLLGCGDGQFDLALCSHLLFLYSGSLDLGFHINAIAEMCRVAQEVRIFPLLQLGSTPSPHVRSVVDHFESVGYEMDRVRVPYEFQRGGDQMLRIRRSSGDAAGENRRDRPTATSRE